MWVREHSSGADGSATACRTLGQVLREDPNRILEAAAPVQTLPALGGEWSRRHDSEDRLSSAVEAVRHAGVAKSWPRNGK